MSGATEPSLHHQHPRLCSDHHLIPVSPTSLLKFPALTTPLSQHCLCNTELIHPGALLILAFPNCQEHDVYADPSVPLIASSLYAGSQGVNFQVTLNNTSQIHAAQTCLLCPKFHHPKHFTLCLFSSSFPFMSNFQFLQLQMYIIKPYPDSPSKLIYT